MAHLATFKALLLCTSIATAMAVTQMYDETLWTKKLWSKWKLDKNFFTGNPTDDDPNLLSAYPDVRDLDRNSLDGPFTRSRNQVRDKKDKTGAEAFSDMQLLPPAAQAVRCLACNTLITHVWQRLIVELLRGQIIAADSQKLIPKYMKEACETQVLHGILQRKVLYQLEVESQAQAMAFFVLRNRRPGTQPTIAESAAVQLACQEVTTSGQADITATLFRHLREFGRDLSLLLKQHGLLPLPGTSHSQPTAAATQADHDDEVNNSETDSEHDSQGSDDGSSAADSIQQEAKLSKSADALQAKIDKLLKGIASQLRKEVVELQRKGKETDEKQSEEEEEDEYLDPDDDDDFDQQEQACADLHPMCEQWANTGECESNPNYMVGNTWQKGHCRKACGVCSADSPQEILRGYPGLAASVEELSNSMLQAAKSQGCGPSQNCMSGSSDVQIGGGVVSTKQGWSKAIKHTGAFVLGRPSWGEPEVVETAQSKLAYQEHAAEEIQLETTVSQLQQQVNSVLGKELGGKLLRLHEDFFTYEYLYKNHTRHYHEEPRFSGITTEDWLLGTFDSEDVVPVRQADKDDDGSVGAALQALDMLPDMTHINMQASTWPYVRQMYANGQTCVLRGGRKVVRQTEVRIACSPDGKLHLLLREPDFCQYIFVIYSPALCSIESYKPQPRQQAQETGSE